jgi:hypothetical protein
MSTSAIGQLATLTCPSDVVLECGQDINNFDLTGYPSFTIYVGAGHSLNFSDNAISSGACSSTIVRTWTLSLEELGGFIGSFQCTQVITVRDTQGPAISGVSDLSLECNQVVPFANATAFDVCSEATATVTNFGSHSGRAESKCVSTTAFGPGADWAIWLPVLASNGVTASANFVFDDENGQFEQYADGTARLSGRILNTANTSQSFAVDFWFKSRRTWNEWSALGRNFKNDLNLACAANNHAAWSYYELADGFSTLTGQGALSGVTLNLSHLPSNHYFGFQVGTGANNKNCSNGMSGWFSYTGNINGEVVNGNGDVNVDLNCTPQLYECNNNDQYTYLYLAKDACYNYTIAKQLITIYDYTAPTFDNCPEDLNIQCPSAIASIPVPAVTATDNCTEVGWPVVNYLGEAVVANEYSDDVNCEKHITRTWEAVDCIGNRSICVQHIRARDTEAPVLQNSPAGEITVECNAIPAVPTLTAIDNCDPNPTVSYYEEIIEGDCPGRYTIIREWEAGDRCYNFSTRYRQTVHVVDTTAPVFDPFDIYTSAECNENPPALTAHDNCSDVTVTVYSEQLNSGGCLGVLIRVYRATDSCGNFADTTQFITITDTTAPVLVNVPAETTIECNYAVVNSNGYYFDQGDVYGTDNCGYEVEISYSESVILTDDSCEASFDIVRTWIATDYCENRDTAYQTVHVIDSTAPVLSIPEDYTIECDQQPVYDPADASDYCSSYTISESRDTIEGNCPSNFIIVRTFVATDACGNASNPRAQRITVQDTTAPVFTAGQQTQYTYECGTIIPVIQPTALDNCAEMVYLSYSDSQQGTSCSYYITRTWTAIDECYNSSYFVQYIHVQDTTAPVIAGTIEITRPCDNYGGIYVTATDVCNTFTITYTEVMVSGGCAGSVIRNYTATDTCGNVSTQFQQIIHLEDTTAPYIVSETADFEVECDEEYTVNPPVFDDNCDDELEMSSYVNTVIDADTCVTVKTYTWTAMDDCGNSVTSTTIVTISDWTNPYFEEFEYELTINCNDLVPAVVIPAAYDNCDLHLDVSYSVSEVPGQCPQEYTIYRVFRAIDNCGNQAVETQTIHVVDEDAPVFASNNQSTFTYECGATIPVVQPIAADSCSQVIAYTYVDGPYTGNTCSRYFSRVWYATDECGNSANYTQTIYIVDTTAPVIAGDIEITLPCHMTDTIAVTATDYCSTFTITYTDTHVSGGCAGTLMRRYLATDVCGNESAPFTQFIHLIDTIAPTAYVSNPIVNISCEVPLPAFSPVFNDLCDDDLDIVYLTDVYTPGNCPASYSLVRRATATDDCGNTVTATQTISVTDYTAPVWDNQSHVITYECGTNIPLVTPTAYDNCSSIIYSYVDGATQLVECVYSFNRLWTATDSCGNASVIFTQTIQSEDTNDPILYGCPSDLVLACDQQLPAPATVTVYDACDDSIDVDYTQYYYGDIPTPGSIADCDLMTPSHDSGGNCGVEIGGNNIDWAMQLMGMPTMHRYYRVESGDLVRYENSIELNATLVNVLDPTSGFNVQVTFAGGFDWETWSSMSYPTGFKADCGGEAANHESWLYFILQGNEGAELSGFGAYAGSQINLTHAPSNNYFGFQYGNGANNYNGSDEAFGGWFMYNGTFQTSNNGEGSLINGAGDFAFDLDCCPDYYVIREWTAVDCSGNMASCQQLITYLGTTPENPGANTVLTEAQVDGKVSAITAYPNPARDNTMFSFKAANTGKTTLEIIDLSGRKVADVYYGAADAGSEYNVLFDTEALATGIYLYRFTNGGEVQMKKLIVSK